MTERVREWITPSVLIQAVVALVTITGAMAVSQWRLNEMASVQDEMRRDSKAQIEQLKDLVSGVREGQIRSDAEVAGTLKALGDRLTLVESDGRTQAQVNARIMADLARLGR